MQTRREFLGTIGGVVTAGEVLSKPVQPAANGYKLLVLATNWGFQVNNQSNPWEEFAARAAGEGYDGVEVWVMNSEPERELFLRTMEKYKLAFGLLCGSGEKDPVRHLEQFKNAIDAALLMKPVYINCHSGRDYFNFEQNKKIVDYSYQASRQQSIPVYHETHRGRMLYSAPITADYLTRLPELRLTLDISHWCNVHESFLADQPEHVALALSRAGHIHARIGHPEGPQVSDPRAPEWEQAVNTHLTWWEKIAATKKQEGKILTVLTEFGPPDYLPALPYTRQPVADQWAINVYMKDLVRKRLS
ncbi:MAG: sugar phosphate isomerase/epimerase [Bacteroidetes bacterium]|nr:sugar phosphate isomerase/epimerase [Bacteroidota bacterium]